MMLIFAVMMMYFGWILAAMQLQTEQKTIILEIPLYLLYGFIPLMGFLMTIRLIQVFYKDIMDLVDQKTSKLSTSA